MYVYPLFRLCVGVYDVCLSIVQTVCRCVCLSIVQTVCRCVYVYPLFRLCVGVCMFIHCSDYVGAYVYPLFRLCRCVYLSIVQTE